MHIFYCRPEFLSNLFREDSICSDQYFNFGIPLVNCWSCIALEWNLPNEHSTQNLSGRKLLPNNWPDRHGTGLSYHVLFIFIDFDIENFALRFRLLSWFSFTLYSCNFIFYSHILMWDFKKRNVGKAIRNIKSICTLNIG